MSESIRDRVQRGAALLDEKQPDWYMMVCVESLELGDCYKCVLGQLIGDYYDGRDWLFPEKRIQQAGTHGFCMLTNESMQPDDDWRLAFWRDLTSEWERAIVIRRENRGKDQPVV